MREEIATEVAIENKPPTITNMERAMKHIGSVVLFASFCALKAYRLAMTLLIAVLCVSAAEAADWYDNVGPVLGRIEPMPDGSIYLGNTGIGMLVTGHSTSCSISQIHLLPPSGQEKAWLATLLAATMAGKAVHVYGECVQSNYRIDATRLLVEY